jgi:hypothetical protein
MNEGMDGKFEKWNNGCPVNSPMKNYIEIFSPI